MYKILAILSVLIMSSCGLIPTETQPNAFEKRAFQIEKCVHRMLQSGMDQTIVYPICKDLYTPVRLQPIEQEMPHVI